MSREGKKRRLSSDESEDPDLEDRLIKVLGRNMSMLNSQLQAQNINCQLDREQRNDHNDSLARALSKLTDAIVKIADKLWANGSKQKDVYEASYIVVEHYDIC